MRTMLRFLFGTRPDDRSDPFEAVIAAVVLASVLVAGCFGGDTRNETALGTVGAAAIREGVEAVWKTKHEREVAARERVAAELAAEQIAHETSKAALALRERRLERQVEVETELRRELDAIKNDREELYGHLDSLAAVNVTDSCPLGSAVRVRAVVEWMRERASTD